MAALAPMVALYIYPALATSQSSGYPPDKPADAAISQEDADAIILERQLVMQGLEKDGEVLGDIVAGLRPPTELVARAQSVSKNARAALKSFEPNVPGGAAKPEVWANGSDFRARMEDFVTKSDELVKASEKGDLVMVGESMVHAFQCKQCHDIYRKKKS